MQFLLTINFQRLLYTVINFDVVKEAKEAVLYIVQGFRSNLQFINSLLLIYIYLSTTVRISTT